MFIFSRVLLRRFCFVFLVRTFIRMVAFTHVCLPTSRWFLFLLCTSIRIVASTRVRLHKKMVPYSLVRFHQNVCFYLGAPALKCLHFLVCAYIFMFAFFRVHLHQFYVYLCAPTSKNGSYFSCASS